MAYIPSPTKYEKTIDWSKNFPTANYGKFFRTRRDLPSHDIENDAKKKFTYFNGKNPGPANYQNDK